MEPWVQGVGVRGVHERTRDRLPPTGQSPEASLCFLDTVWSKVPYLLNLQMDLFKVQGLSLSPLPFKNTWEIYNDSKDDAKSAPHRWEWTVTQSSAFSTCEKFLVVSIKSLHQNLLWSSSFLDDYTASPCVITTSQSSCCRKTAKVIVHFRTEQCSKCLTSSISRNSHNNPEKLVLLSSYFIDEEIEAWRVTSQSWQS